MSGYWVYILYSEKGDVYYKGSSGDPAIRLVHHNTTERGYTTRYRPWRLVFRKEYRTKAEAQAAERRLKEMKSREMIERIIRGERDI